MLLQHDGVCVGASIHSCPLLLSVSPCIPSCAVPFVCYFVTSCHRSGAARRTTRLQQLAGHRSNDTRAPGGHGSAAGAGVCTACCKEGVWETHTRCVSPIDCATRAQRVLAAKKGIALVVALLLRTDNMLQILMVLCRRCTASWPSPSSWAEHW